MADEGDVLTDINPDPATGANGADNQPAAGIITQYIKDLSVENPNAPDCFQWTEQPQIDVQLNIGATQVNEEVHEVELKMTVSATGEKGNLYLVDLSYCGLAGLRNLPDEHAHAFLYAEAPRILFPFARRVIADATRDAGFPPFMMEPMDFGALYQQRMAQVAQERQEGEGGNEAAPSGEA
ncbi:MAG: protein-export chaperone SecB [Qipengyuania sp.]